MKRVFKYTVADDYADKKIKVFLKSHYKMSTALVSDLKKTDDGIIVNGERQTVAYTLRKGDEITITIRELSKNEIIPAPINFKVLYEDEDVMVVEKPPFVPTHQQRMVAQQLLRQLRIKGDAACCQAGGQVIACHHVTPAAGADTSAPSI